MRVGRVPHRPLRPSIGTRYVFVLRRGASRAQVIAEPHQRDDVLTVVLENALKISAGLRVKGRSALTAGPRIWRELRKDGVRVGKQRLQTLMSQRGIRVKGRKPFQGQHRQQLRSAIAPNLLERQFTVTKSDTVWLATSPTSILAKVGCTWP